MAKFKTIEVDWLDRPRTASYGVPEMREISKISGADLFRGQSWSANLTQETAFKVLHVLLRRDDASLTVEQVEDMIVPDLPTMRQISDLCIRLEMNMSLDEAEQKGKDELAKSAESKALETIPLEQRPN